MEVALIVTFLAAMLVIALVVYLFLRDAERQRQAEYRRSVMTEVLPNRLQAYERLSLYLDRIAPQSMAVREQISVSTAKELYLAMLNSVRMEFEHNVAMQIYITEASWKRVVRARDEVTKSLNEAIKGVAPDATALEFSAEFIEIGRNTCDFYVERAKEGLRKDVAGEFIAK